jgi:hypothetical protein
MMYDWGAFWTIAAFLAGCVVGAWAAIRECANAALHGGRKWWKIAIHSAEHRIAHRKFKLGLDEVNELERHVK